MVLFGINFDLLPTEAYISRVHREHDVVEGHFYVVALESRLRFPLSDFIVDVLNDYEITPSQLVPNSWHIHTTFFIGCRRMLIDPISRVFTLFYNLKMRERWYCKHLILSGIVWIKCA